MFLETITCLSCILHDNSWYQRKYFYDITRQQSIGPPGGVNFKAVSPEYFVCPSFAQYLPSNGVEMAYLGRSWEHKMDNTIKD